MGRGRRAGLERDVRVGAGRTGAHDRRRASSVTSRRRPLALEFFPPSRCRPVERKIAAAHGHQPVGRHHPPRASQDRNDSRRSRASSRGVADGAGCGRRQRVPSVEAVEAQGSLAPGATGRIRLEHLGPGSSRVQASIRPDRAPSRAPSASRGHHLDLGSRTRSASSANIGRTALKLTSATSSPQTASQSATERRSPPPQAPLHRYLNAPEASNFARRHECYAWPPAPMLRSQPCRRSTARLHSPAPRRWPSRCASSRRGWRPIWRARSRASPDR